jgi:hypothetical protein
MSTRENLKIFHSAKITKQFKNKIKQNGKDKKQCRIREKTNYETLHSDPEKTFSSFRFALCSNGQHFQRVETYILRGMRSDLYAFFSKTTHDKRR